jgi:hypothetical protein
VLEPIPAQNSSELEAVVAAHICNNELTETPRIDIQKSTPNWESHTQDIFGEISSAQIA